MTGLGALALIIAGIALWRYAASRLGLWWLRRQTPAPPPAWYEERRIWQMACAYRDKRLAHPAHRWRRGAWTNGGVPTSHPNWCPGYAEAPGRPGAR